MKNAIKYKVEITLDGVHRHMDQVIEEIWIPELNVCFNARGGCFESDSPRGSGVDVELTDEELGDIKEYMQSKIKLDMIRKNRL